ncbi:MAG: hypothetical protein J0M08_03400 [Bacteroidetes bacterium]|nr:hypothetical protein [Bacteroidota bacterium]
MYLLKTNEKYKSFYFKAPDYSLLILIKTRLQKHIEAWRIAEQYAQFAKEVDLNFLKIKVAFSKAQILLDSYPKMPARNIQSVLHDFDYWYKTTKESKLSNQYLLTYYVYCKMLLLSKKYKQAYTYLSNPDCKHYINSFAKWDLHASIYKLMSEGKFKLLSDYIIKVEKEMYKQENSLVFEDYKWLHGICATAYKNNGLL